MDHARATDSQLGRSSAGVSGISEFSEEQGERVLEKRTGPQGETLRPAMRIDHMKHEDAKAIIAYLKSLPRAVADALSQSARILKCGK